MVKVRGTQPPPSARTARAARRRKPADILAKGTRVLVFPRLACSRALIRVWSTAARRASNVLGRVSVTLCRPTRKFRGAAAAPHSETPKDWRIPSQQGRSSSCIGESRQRSRRRVARAGARNIHLARSTHPWARGETPRLTLSALLYISRQAGPAPTHT